MSLIVVVQNVSECESVKGLPDTYGVLPNNSVYRYEIRINERVIAQGDGVKHKRSEGWEKLVRRVLHHHRRHDG